MTFVLSALSTLLLTGFVIAQSSYYALSRSLALTAPPNTSYDFNLMFYMVDIPSLAVSISFESHSYSLFYFPRASQLCIQHSQRGATVSLNIQQGSFDSFSFSETSVLLNGIEMAFHTAICSNSSNLKPAHFSEPIGQISIDVGASSLSAQASGLLTLADQSCISKSQTNCTKCVAGYRLTGNPVVCQPMPYGCLEADMSGGCALCRHGFDLDVSSGRCSNDGLSNESVSLEYEYSLSVPKNELQIKGSTEEAILIKKGEWNLVTLYQDPPKSILKVEKNGATSKNETMGLTTARFNINSIDLTLYLKQLIIWNQINNIQSHSCRFTHSYSPFALYAFDTDTITTVLTDSMGNLNSLGSGILPQSTTYSDLIYTYQPISNLEDHFFYEQKQGFPLCMECSPDCRSCSDLYTCTHCSSGLLDNGFCHSSRLNSLSGLADISSFSYEGTYDSINQHINVELLQDPSTQFIQVSSYLVEYPDNSTHLISNISSFTLPKYREVGLTKFNAKLKVEYSLGESASFTTQVAIIEVNQVYTQAEFIKDTIRAALIPISSDNECGCTSHSTCSTEIRKCQCHEGYSGYLCQFTQEEIENYQNQVNQELEEIQANQASLTPEDLLADLEYLSRESDALTPESTSAILNLVTSLLNSGSLQTHFQLSLEILSHITQAASRSSTVALTEAVKACIDKIVSLHLPSTSTVSLTASKIALKIQAYEWSHESRLSLSSDSSLVLPAEMIKSGQVAQLVSVIYSEPIYDSKLQQGSSSATQVISIHIYENGQAKQIKDLEHPFELSLPISNVVQSEMHSHGSDDTYECSFYNEQEGILSSSGCSLLSKTHTQLKCNCNHMTDFVGILSPSSSHTMHQSHASFNLLDALSELNFQNLRHNFGFLFAVSYLGVFCLVLLPLCLLDRRDFKSKFDDQLYSAVHHETDAEGRTNQSSYLNGLVDNSNLCFSVSSNPVAVHPLSQSTSKDRQEVIMKNYKEDDQSLSNGISFTPPDPNLKVKRRYSKRRKSRFSMTSDSEGKSILPKKKKFSPVEKIKKRLNKILYDPKISKSCCCVFQKLAKNELTTNNQMYNLVTSYNPLNRRTNRFMFCYAAILLEFVACALFCFLGHSTGHQEKSFQDEILFNFLVAVFSALLTIGPLILLGLQCQFPRKWMKHLKQAQSAEQVKTLYRNYEKRMNCRLVMNITLFLLITLVELLFVVSFGHVASDAQAKEWLFSSLISIGLDIVVFEVAAAFGFACCGVMKKFCRGCEGIVWLIIILEIYRVYRNLVVG